MVLNVNGLHIAQKHSGHKEFGQSPDEAQEKNNWRQRIKGQG